MLNFDLVGRPSPWGAIDSVTELAPGAWFVTTPSHGGIKLDLKRFPMPKEFQLHHMNELGWYEEDCEAALVVIVYPSLFKPGALEEAEFMVKSVYPHEYMAYTKIEVKLEESYQLRKEKFAVDHKNDWVVVSALGMQDGNVKCIAALGGRDNNYHYDRVKAFIVPKEEYNPGENGFVIDTKRHKEVPNAKG